jgi:hypothetical protein
MGNGQYQERANTKWHSKVSPHMYNDFLSAYFDGELEELERAGRKRFSGLARGSRNAARAVARWSVGIVSWIPNSARRLKPAKRKPHRVASHRRKGRARPASDQSRSRNVRPPANAPIKVQRIERVERAPEYRADGMWR